MSSEQGVRCPESAAVVYISEEAFQVISDRLRRTCQCAECFPDQLREALTLVSIKVDES